MNNVNHDHHRPYQRQPGDCLGACLMGLIASCTVGAVAGTIAGQAHCSPTTEKICLIITSLLLMAAGAAGIACLSDIGRTEFANLDFELRLVFYYIPLAFSSCALIGGLILFLSIMIQNCRNATRQANPPPLPNLPPAVQG